MIPGKPVDVWLRGPIADVPPQLQPAAHTFLQVGEEVPPLVRGLSTKRLWARPGGAAAIGFHLMHLPGSADRLLAYARGAPLNAEQHTALERERTVHDDRPSLKTLLDTFEAGIEDAVKQLRAIPEANLFTPREVGRKRLPSTTLGLIFHAAEHSYRHAGQIATMIRVVPDD